MNEAAAVLPSTASTAGEDFADALAREIRASHADAMAAGDLSALVVLVPALPVAADLRAALARAAARPLLLPRIDTLPRWVAAMAANEVADAAPGNQRASSSCTKRCAGAAGSTRRHSGESPPRSRSSSAGFPPTLALPADAAALAAELERAYRLRASAPLAFEAHVVQVVARAGRQRPARRRGGLSPAAGGDPAQVAATAVVVVVCGGTARRRPRRRAVGFALARRARLPARLRRARARLDLPSLGARRADFAASSPRSPRPGRRRRPPPRPAPLFARAGELARRRAASPLAGRLRFVPADGREQEAQAAVAQVGEWLAADISRIALIAQDRPERAAHPRAARAQRCSPATRPAGRSAPRARRRRSTRCSRRLPAAPYHRDLLDLCKSPCVFADCDEAGRKAAVFAIESARCAPVR